MKYTIGINQSAAVELGLNLSQAVIFDLLTSASSWAEAIQVDGETYFWVARQAIVRELPLLDLKPDTAYRHLKLLADKGLIAYTKAGKKDCVRLTDKGRSYLSDTMSEINPSSYVGKKSESNSEINPTYPTTNNNPIVLEAPAGLNQTAWVQYFEYRKAIKAKPLKQVSTSNLAAWLINQGDLTTQQAIVDQTIRKGWTGLYELKRSLEGMNHGSHKPTARLTSADKMRQAANEFVSSLEAHG